MGYNSVDLATGTPYSIMVLSYSSVIRDNLTTLITNLI